MLLFSDYQFFLCVGEMGNAATKGRSGKQSYTAIRKPIQSIPEPSVENGNNFWQSNYMRLIISHWITMNVFRYSTRTINYVVELNS